ncbi:MAG TPA: hypothetical protein ENK31_05185 [Nannocystis exedens]|nr:hypothetical protein [Nannocystis exedens]
MAWYISNIVGDPGVKDGNGYISRLNSDGSVDAMQWATGFDGPKGLAIRGDRLYVADIDRLHVVNVVDGTILKTHTIAGAGFLNDVAVDMMGSVYVSDTATNTIHVLKGGNAPQVFLQNDDLHGANGLAFAGDRLFVASIGDGNKEGAIYEIKGGAAVQLGSLSGSLDGLVAQIDTLLVTVFNGLLYEVPYADGVPVLLRDLAADNSFMSSADLGLARDLGILAIPDLLGDKVGFFPI